MTAILSAALAPARKVYREFMSDQAMANDDLLDKLNVISACLTLVPSVSGG